MPVRPCPTCDRPTVRAIENVTLYAHVNYYRCEHCGHVWHTPKDNPDAPPTTVMQGCTAEKLTREP